VLLVVEVEVVREGREWRRKNSAFVIVRGWEEEEGEEGFNFNSFDMRTRVRRTARVWIPPLLDYVLGPSCNAINDAVGRRGRKKPKNLYTVCGKRLASRPQLHTVHTWEQAASGEVSILAP